MRVVDQQYVAFGRCVWAVALLAAGQASTLCGTLAGQYVMEGFLRLKATPTSQRSRCRLSRKQKHLPSPQVAAWKRLLVTRLVALVPAVAVAVWAGHTASVAADTLNEWINVQQSCQVHPCVLQCVQELAASLSGGLGICGAAAIRACPTAALQPRPLDGRVGHHARRALCALHGAPPPAPRPRLTHNPG